MNRNAISCLGDGILGRVSDCSRSPVVLSDNISAQLERLGSAMALLIRQGIFAIVFAVVTVALAEFVLWIFE
jgi:hypothetical protein